MEVIRLRPNPAEELTIAVEALPGRTPGYVFMHGMTSCRQGRKSEALLARAEAQGRAFSHIPTHPRSWWDPPWVDSLQPGLEPRITTRSPALGYLPQMSERRGNGDAILLSPEAVLDARQYDEASLPGMLPMPVPVPVLVAHGMQDKSIPPERSRLFCEGIRGPKKLLLIKDGSHALDESVDLIYDEIEQFMGLV